MKKFKLILILIGFLFFYSCGEKTIDLTEVEYDDLFQEDEKGVYYKKKLFTGKIVKYKYVDGPLLYEKNIKNGKPNGKSITYFKNGSPEKIWEFSNDTLIKYSHFLEDSSTYKQYDNKGNFLNIQKFSDGSKDTLLFQKFNEKKDPTGKWIKYDPYNDKTKVEIVFQNDTVIKKTYKTKGIEEKTIEKFKYDKDNIIYFFPDSKDLSIPSPFNRKVYNFEYLYKELNKKFSNPIRVGKFEKIEESEGILYPQIKGNYKDGKPIGEWIYNTRTSRVNKDFIFFIKNKYIKKSSDKLFYPEKIVSYDEGIPVLNSTYIVEWDGYHKYSYFYKSRELKLIKVENNRKYILSKYWEQDVYSERIFSSKISLKLIKNECVDLLERYDDDCKIESWSIDFSSMGKMIEITHTTKEGDVNEFSSEYVYEHNKPRNYIVSEELKQYFNENIKVDVDKLKISLFNYQSSNSSNSNIIKLPNEFIGGWVCKIPQCEISYSLKFYYENNNLLVSGYEWGSNKVVVEKDNDYYVFLIDGTNENGEFNLKMKMKIDKDGNLLLDNDSFLFCCGDPELYPNGTKLIRCK